MRRELAMNVRARLKQQLLDKLLAANPVEVPKSLVDAQVREMQIDSRTPHRREGCLAGARRRSRSSSRRVAAWRSACWSVSSSRPAASSSTGERVEARLAEVAGGYPDPEAILKAYRQNAGGACARSRTMVLEDQVVDYLLERAKVTDQPSTFKECDELRSLTITRRSSCLH